MVIEKSRFDKSNWFTCVGLFIGLACAVGCQPATRDVDTQPENVSTEVATPEPLVVTIVDSMELGPKIERQWRARRNGEITIIHRTFDQWQSSQFGAGASDVLIYPAAALADVIQNERVLPVPGAVLETEEVAWRDLLKRCRQDVVGYDDQIWGLPLSSPQWVLLYRADLLRKANVSVPTNWAEWKLAVAALRDADLSIDVNDRVSIPLSDGFAAHVLLMRSAALVRQQGKLSTVFDRSTMRPMIDQPPFLQALQDLKDQFGNQSDRVTPAETYHRLLKGQCAMAITWPTSSDSDEFEVDALVAENISVAEVPGSDQWYDLQAGKWIERASAEEQRSVGYIGFGDLIGSVSSDSRNASSAFDFLQWLCSKPISGLVLTSAQHSGPFRRSHLKSASRWGGPHLSPKATENWTDAIGQTHKRPVVLVFPRVPGYCDYIDALDVGVRKCLTEGRSAKETLAGVAAQWESITERIGREEQSANLRRGNGF